MCEDDRGVMEGQASAAAARLDLACCRLGMELGNSSVGVEENAMHEAVGRSAKLVSKSREEAVRRRPHMEGSKSLVME